MISNTKSRWHIDMAAAAIARRGVVIKAGYGAVRGQPLARPYATALQRRERITSGEAGQEVKIELPVQPYSSWVSLGGL